MTKILNRGFCQHLPCEISSKIILIYGYIIYSHIVILIIQISYFFDIAYKIGISYFSIIVSYFASSSASESCKLSSIWSKLFSFKYSVTFSKLNSLTIFKPKYYQKIKTNSNY